MPRAKPPTTKPFTIFFEGRQTLEVRYLSNCVRDTLDDLFTDLLKKEIQSIKKDEIERLRSDCEAKGFGQDQISQALADYEAHLASCPYYSKGAREAWEYFSNNLPQAIHELVFLLCHEAYEYAWSDHSGACVRVDHPHKADLKNAVETIEQMQKGFMKRRLGAPGRGGDRRSEWTDDRRCQFLDVFESAKKRVSDAINRCPEKDPFRVRLAVLAAANGALPDSEHLPAHILEQIAKWQGKRAGLSLVDLALEVAAVEFGVDATSYLLKILTQARRLRSAKRKISGHKKLVLAATQK